MTRALITGAEGTIGTAIRCHLGDRFDLRLLTREPVEFASFVGDISKLHEIAPAFESVDAVVHLAASASEHSEWEEVLTNNIVGTRNVFEAAHRSGVGRVVFASSNHAVAMHEQDAGPGLYELDDGRVIPEDVEARPDSLYGVSKVFGETLGRYYADVHGLKVVCLRIGSVNRNDDPCGDPARGRMRAIWLSQRDCAELIASALTADVRYAVVYGTSNNPRQFLSLAGAAALGFKPKDSAPEHCPD